jgi:hypothetical protein
MKKTRKWFNASKVKKPKVPKLIKSTHSVINGLLLSVHNSAGNNLLHNIVDSGFTYNNEKPVIGAGRGGKHYGKTSAMGQMADSAFKTIRQKKKEITPYKPIPQMHTFKSLADMRRY